MSKKSKKKKIWIGVIVVIVVIIVFYIYKNKNENNLPNPALQAGMNPSGSISQNPSTTAPTQSRSQNLDFSKPLHKGVDGKEVEELQRTINKNGISITVDGIFGQQTEDALLDIYGTDHITLDELVQLTTAVW